MDIDGKSGELIRTDLMAVDQLEDVLLFLHTIGDGWVWTIRPATRTRRQRLIIGPIGTTAQQESRAVGESVGCQVCPGSIPPLLPWFSSRRCPAPRFVLLGIGAKCLRLQRLVSHCQATADGKWPDLGIFLLKLKAKKFMTTCQVCVHRVFLSEARPEKRPLGLPSHGQCWLFGMFNDGSNDGFRKDRTVKTKGVTIRPCVLHPRLSELT